MKQVYKMIKMFILRDKREPGSSQGSLTFAQIGLKWGGGESCMSVSLTSPLGIALIQGREMGQDS